jgi:hypothetical protein
MSLIRLWPEALALGLTVYALTNNFAQLPLYWRATFVLLLLVAVFLTLAHTSRWLQTRIVHFARLWTPSHERAVRVYYFVMRPGVLVHEMAHALFALLFGGKITEFTAWETSEAPQNRGATRGQRSVRLGHVRYTLRGRSRFRSRLKQAVIGFAPLPVGVAVIGLLLWLQRVGLPTDAEPVNLEMLKSLPWTEPLFWASLLCVLWVANLMTPSSADRTEWPSALALLAVVVLVIALIWWAVPGAGPILAAWSLFTLNFMSLLTVILGVPIGVNLLMGLLLLGIGKLTRRPIRR